MNVNQQTTLTAQMSGSDAGVPPTGTMTFLIDGNAVSGVRRLYAFRPWAGWYRVLHAHDSGPPSSHRELFR